MRSSSEIIFFLAIYYAHLWPQWLAKLSPVPRTYYVLRGERGTWVFVSLRRDAAVLDSASGTDPGDPCRRSFPGSSQSKKKKPTPGAASA